MLHAPDDRFPVPLWLLLAAALWMLGYACVEVVDAVQAGEARQ